MTKYILNSGGYSNYPKLAKEFFAEVVKDFNNPRFLVVPFAQQREDWETKFEEDKKGRFKEFIENTEPVFELALPQNFVEQVRNSDIIYIHGGDDHLVQYWLKKFNVPEIWEGKVVTANSASSDAVSKYYWTNDWRECGEGLGVLPIKFFPHFKSNYGDGDPRGPIDWEEALQELKSYKEDLPVYALREGEYAVFNQ